MPELQLEDYWKLKGFSPNPKQEEAIRHIEGPLFLTAGPGSGKTRVLLWRTLNLIVFHRVDPESIFLATFTEKAAHQLKEGLRSLLGLVTNQTGKAYDISGMSIGTVHAICRSILVDTDRRFAAAGERGRAPIVLDELSQYFKVYNRVYWIEMLTAAGYHPGVDSEAEQQAAQEQINAWFGHKAYSRHVAVVNVIRLFNRFSEENLDPTGVKTEDDVLKKLLKMYEFYQQSHWRTEQIQTADFSRIQQLAFQKIADSPSSAKVYEHIIIDEYQDTNAIQEQIYFALAAGSRNICVVGDDDQALYRFRGATVENLVEFESRCESSLGLAPKRIDLSINYRSQKAIVDFYVDFISRSDWRKVGGGGHYRMTDKNIQPFHEGQQVAVMATEKQQKEAVFQEVAQWVDSLKQTGKIADYNQVAFLFPALKNQGDKNTKVQGFEEALNALGIRVFAPRAGRILEVEEAVDIFGLLFSIFGRPSHQGRTSRGGEAFRSWQKDCLARAEDLMQADALLAEYVADKRAEMAQITQDYEALLKFAARKKWKLQEPVRPEVLRTLITTPGVSQKCRATLGKKAFVDLVKSRENEGRPLLLSYVINRVTSVDWSVLDLFYHLNGFRHFQQMFELAQSGADEGPVCNLGLVTQYLSRFMEEYTPIITASFLQERRFVNTFIGSYLYAIFRLGETEYEDADDPFPKGRVPFLTVHQSKGLEFPYVVMGNLFRTKRDPDPVEVATRALLQKEGEPIDRIAHFDNMRMFYVALSRAQLGLLLPHFGGRGQQVSEPFKQMLAEGKLPLLGELAVDQLPVAKSRDEDLGRNYSYTADYMSYRECPRKYMIFRKYGFVPSRTQTMFFGSLVHQTIEDLHHLLISERKKQETE